MVARYVKPLLEMLVTHIRAPVRVLITPLLSQLPTNGPEKVATDGLNTRAPATQVEGSDAVPGSWPQPSPTAAAVACH